MIDYIPKCPRCGGNNVVPKDKKFFVILGICNIAASCILIFPFPPLGIGGIMLGVGLLIYSIFAENYFHCKGCMKLWKEKG